MALIIVLAERPNASVLVVVMFFAKGNILPLVCVSLVCLANATRFTLSSTPRSWATCGICRCRAPHVTAYRAAEAQSSPLHVQGSIQRLELDSTVSGAAVSSIWSWRVLDLD